ncbi:MAG TPA: hypothetical protein VFC05_14155 [Nitrososphaeraceae archaeon]|nr:hypothetical protein [Nitrososphaeraceae archaeon]
MGKAKKDIRIIKRDSNKEDYTFVSDNILKNVDNIKNNPSGTTTNEKIENRSRERKKKILTKKVDNKGRKILGKSLQGHSPIYE